MSTAWFKTYVDIYIDRLLTWYDLFSLNYLHHVQTADLLFPNKCSESISM